MIDIGLSKLALIGVVALVVIGPEKLPRVARTVGALLGKAQRYVADVKAEVSRSIELDELRRAKAEVEAAAHQVQTSVEQTTRSVSSEIESGLDWSRQQGFDTDVGASDDSPISPVYHHPGKKFRLRSARVPQWFKQQNRQRTHVQSGAARVARLRPKTGWNKKGF